MVIDEAQCRAVLAAEKKTGRKNIVTHNYRYAPKHQKIKELLLAGEIGTVTSVDFNWYLDTSHGADYFRRWHRLRSKSGSLWVHKASHHFDLINWWLAADPVQVSAFGSLANYGKAGKLRHTDCRSCPHKKDVRTTGTSIGARTWLSSTTTASPPTATCATAASSRKTSTSSTP